LKKIFCIALFLVVATVALCLETTIPTVTLTSGVQAGVQCRESEWPKTTLTITVTTDYSTTCKYDTSDVEYAAMANTFTTTGSTSHVEQINFSCGTTHTYYIKCSGATNDFDAIFKIDDDPRPRRRYEVQ